MARGVNKELFTLSLNSNQITSFWNKVDIKSDTECWDWIGAKKPRGYGNCHINKKYYLAHRVSFWIANGDFPDRFIVCHSCDNPKCCNPSHLLLGSNKSNFMDLFLKVRNETVKYSLFGQNNVNSKLTNEKVTTIRKCIQVKKLTSMN